MTVAPGTIVVHSDIGCPWATVAVIRLHEARRRLGLEGRVGLDHRAFALEIANEQRTPFRTLAGEIPAAGALEPGFGWQVWQGDPTTWPVTTMPALEAVQAAKRQGLGVSADLDLALRRALFAESRCISLRHVVRDVASTVDGLDLEALMEQLDRGTARHDVVSQSLSADDGVQGSPHLFLPDGSDEFNPGVEIHWEGDHGVGFVVVDRDDRSVYDRLLKTAAKGTDQG